MTLNSDAIFKHFRARFDPSTKRGVEVGLPAWVDIKTWQKGKAVKDVLSAFQSALAIRFACSKLFNKTHGFFDVDSDGGVPGKLTALTVMLRIIPPCFSNAENDLSQDAIHDLETLSSADLYKAISAEITAQYRDNKSASAAINELLCQGFDRDGAIFTPKDVAIFMGRLAGIENDCVDIYCNYGAGLYYGNAIHHASNIRLVGNEIADTDNSWPRQFPERLDLAYREAEYAFNRSAVLERMVTELEWATFGQDEKKSKSLLINAALNDLPFYESIHSEKPRDSLDHLLKAGYKKLVVLAPNAYLTGGRGLGNSQNVFQHCVSMGLTGVIQLPAGVIGASHEAYSILEFEPGSRSTKIDFRNIDFGRESDPARLYQKADRGFGLPMRRNELNLGAITSEGGMPQASRTIRSVDDVLSHGISHPVRSKRAAQLVSFEASRFIEQKGFKDLYPHLQFVPLSDLVHIYRIQHVQSALPEDGIEYLEIGGNDIGPFGNIEGGTKKYIDVISESRLNKARLNPGDLFLCIRGSVGKVCLMGPESDIPTVPNQSFVKLTFKKNPKENEVNPELLFWWLNSVKCKEYLTSKALSQGVPRLSISDVANLDIPVGPWAILELEYKKYHEWKRDVNLALDYENKAHLTGLLAFKNNQKRY
jgi:hypothetical protein